MLWLPIYLKYFFNIISIWVVKKIFFMIVEKIYFCDGKIGMYTLYSFQYLNINIMGHVETYIWAMYGFIFFCNGRRLWFICRISDIFSFFYDNAESVNRWKFKKLNRSCFIIVWE